MRDFCLSEKFRDRSRDDSSFLGRPSTAHPNTETGVEIHIPFTTVCLASPLDTQYFDIFSEPKHESTPCRIYTSDSTCDANREYRVARRLIHSCTINTAKAIRFCVQI